jgi:hypothetical protein
LETTEWRYQAAVLAGGAVAELFAAPRSSVAELFGARLLPDLVSRLAAVFSRKKNALPAVD